MTHDDMFVVVLG